MFLHSHLKGFVLHVQMKRINDKLFFTNYRYLTENSSIFFVFSFSIPHKQKGVLLQGVFLYMHKYGGVSFRYPAFENV